MINAPVPKRRIYFRGTEGGTLSAYDAMVIDQANNSWNGWTLHHPKRLRRDALQGYNSNKVPMGLSMRVRYRYGWTLRGSRLTHVVGIVVGIVEVLDICADDRVLL